MSVPKLVRALLGYASISMTMDLYSHWAPAMGDQTAMEDVLQEDHTEPKETATSPRRAGRGKRLRRKPGFVALLGVLAQ